MKTKQKISSEQVKSLVVYYYITQEDRKRFYNQERCYDDLKEERQIKSNNEKSSFLMELAERARDTENDIKKVLDDYTKNHEIGSWIRSVYGIGPILAAGILSYIDITKVHHAGSIWVYAGINAEAKWNKGEKRPWNQHLKNISWKIGNSFCKFQNNENCYYGKILKERKIYEWKKNQNGEYAEQANNALKERNFKEDTDAYQWYSGQFNQITITDKNEYKGIYDLSKGDGIPMLPPAHIMSRVMRYTTKRFYSDLYVVWYETHYKKKAPLPYVIVSSRFPEHSEYVKPYNYESPYPV